MTDGERRRDVGASDAGAFEVLNGNRPYGQNERVASNVRKGRTSGDTVVLVLFRVSCGERYLDGGVVDSMASLYISDQLLDGSANFSHAIRIIGEPLH